MASFESQVPSHLLDQPISTSLSEAGSILEQLAGVFFPAGSSIQDASTIAEAGTDDGLDIVARYQTLLEQIPAVVFLVFLDRGIGEAYVSPQIENILGFSQEEWLNDPVQWYRQIHPEDKARWSIEAARMFLAGEPLRSVYRVIARDSRVVWFQCDAKMVRRNDGRPWFIHGVGFDVTELKQAEAALLEAHNELERRVQERTAALASANVELEQEIIQRKRAEKERAAMLAREQEARQQAEVANRIKDEFLATVSHELRTPLNAILGWATILRSSPQHRSDSTHALEVIERNARAQKKLIEDLLDVSRIITGKLRLDLRPVELNQIVENCIDTMRPVAEAKKLILRSKLPPVAVAVLGDPARLQQILWNLLSNAVRFTPEGGSVALHVKVIERQVVISVTDTGIGIDPDFLPHVFDRFRQADGSLTRAQGGLGLGLAIVRHLVELHGGTVEAESGGKQQGSTFRVSLPLLGDSTSISGDEPQAELETSVANIDLDSGPRFEGTCILVVDDEFDSLEMVAKLLAKVGAEVVTAPSASAALEELSQAKFDLLISDLQMPGEHGYDLIKKVRARQDDEGGSIPAIALSAHGRPEDRSRSIASGYNAHLTKPFEPGELIALVNSLIGQGNYVSG